MKTAFVLVAFFSFALCIDQEDLIYSIEKKIFGYTSASVEVTKKAVSVQVNKISLYLYTRENPSVPEQLSLNISDFRTSVYYSANRKNVFVVHGWLNQYKSSFCQSMSKALLNASDVNVIIVDWSAYSETLYSASKSATLQGGTYLGEFILKMQTNFGLKSSNFIIYGHSLGAHFAGIAGNTAGSKISAIIGLDPAGPFYSKSNSDNRLSKDDAEYVQGIHTSAGYLGVNYVVGHADFWPNGGSRQPGCTLDVTRSCAHSRSYEYAAESIVSGNFYGYSCTNYNTFKKDSCNNSSKAYMGELDVDKRAHGNYFLDTALSAPFALGEINK